MIKGQDFLAVLSAVFCGVTMSKLFTNWLEMQVPL